MDCTTRDGGTGSNPDTGTTTRWVDYITHGGNYENR